MKMEISQELLRQIVSDLGLDVPFAKNQRIQIKNWGHLQTSVA